MLEENCGVMEKQTPRQVQVQHKSNGGAVERRNDYTPNRNGWQRRFKETSSKTQESTLASSRPAQKWGKPNGDKRPRQRGYSEDRQREEVAEDEDGCFEEGPIYASNSRKGNGNHLLSFQYERRGAQQITWPSYKSAARPRYNNTALRYKKEQFLQASYQFVVRDTGQYVEQAINPDALVTWDMVELVRNHTAEEVKCSICLMTPMAGKITKCGHTYCWACILHYLSLDESSKQGCPLCHQPIASDELRSIQHIKVPHVKEGEAIEMKLMRKNKGSVYVCPKENWMDKEGKPLNIHDGVATDFNKLMVASTAQIFSDVIEIEKAALAVQLIDAEDYESGFILMAQDNLNKREKELNERMDLLSLNPKQEEIVTVAEETVKEEAPLPPDMSFDGSKIATTYTDAFEDEADSGIPPSPTEKKRNESVGEETIPFETMHHETVAETEGAFSEHFEDPKERPDLTAPDNSMPVPESTLTASEAADHLELPYESPGGAEARRPNRCKDVYYFYQAATGQHIYLNSLNVQCLVKEYGSLENSPDTIKGTVVAIDRIFMNEEMRKRFRYLNHIPLTCEIQIVELKLQAPTVSKETLKHFQADFEKRRKMRQRKLRAEKAWAKKLEAEQRKRNPEYYPDYTIVNSDLFPRPHSTSELATTPDAKSDESTGTLTPTPVDETGTSPVSEKSGTSPVSFAQIIKSRKSVAGPGLAQSSWPKPMSTSYSAPALNKAAASVAEEEEEEGRPPSYAASMFQAWDNVTFLTPTKQEATTASAQSSGGKKKKKKEKQVLFSTAMARKS